MPQGPLFKKDESLSTAGTKRKTILEESGEANKKQKATDKEENLSDVDFAMLYKTGTLNQLSIQQLKAFLKKQ